MDIISLDFVMLHEITESILNSFFLSLLIDISFLFMKPFSVN